jgi:hypothetical protein
MAFYRRRLPHIYQTQQAVFLTWRLYDSLPLHRAFPTAALNSGQAFDAMDRLLDEARTGAFYLRQPAVADMVVEAIQYNAIILGHWNPVRAGLVSETSEYGWSSAGWATRGSPADPGVRPTAGQKRA